MESSLNEAGMALAVMKHWNVGRCVLRNNEWWGVDAYALCEGNE